MPPPHVHTIQMFTFDATCSCCTYVFYSSVRRVLYEVGFNKPGGCLGHVPCSSPPHRQQFTHGSTLTVPTSPFHRSRATAAAAIDALQSWTTYKKRHKGGREANDPSSNRHTSDLFSFHTLVIRPPHRVPCRSPQL